MKRALNFVAAVMAAAGFTAAPALAGEKITIQGSDTLLEMVTAEAAAFMKANPAVSIQVTGGGSGTGVAAIINGSVDVANSSRPMKEKEKKMIEAKGGEVFEVAIALDGISIYMNKKNPVANLTMAQLAGIFSGKINNWKEVGGADHQIIRYSRENNSGTYAFFKEHVLDKLDYAPDCQNMPGTASVVNAVSKDPYGIGYGGISYSEGVNMAKIDGVAPGMETIIAGSYPVSRKLFQYTVGKPKGAAKAFIAYELSKEGQAHAKKAGYIPLPEALRTASLKSLD
ncbi:MAG: phosphate ABC transporter substrate-binding protein [Nitrospinae bacterium]|nr:phosphate ABC transporter substrate-binding protein [Nitrospinota bacterium]